MQERILLERAKAEAENEAASLKEQLKSLLAQQQQQQQQVVGVST
jgi:hypothetical protein